MNYNEKYGQFLVALGKKTGQVAVCEAAHAAYKACCEARLYRAQYNCKSTPSDGHGESIDVCPAMDLDRNAMTHEIAEVKRSTGRMPKFDEPFVLSAWKDDGGEGSLVTRYSYIDDTPVVEKTGTHRNSEKVMPPSTAKYAQRIAREKYGIELEISDEILLSNRGGYCYGYAPGLVGKCITQDYAEGPSNGGDYYGLAKELRPLGFDMMSEYFGEGEASFRPSGIIYYFPYVKAARDDF